MSRNFVNFIFIAGFCAVVISCSWNKFDGAYSGTLTAENKRLAVDRSVSDTTTEEEKNLLVVIKQEGNEAFLSINGSRFLGDCNLRAKISKNGAAYFDSPQTCTNSLPLEGSVSVGGNELIFSLRGYGQTSNETYQFRGLKK